MRRRAAGNCLGGEGAAGGDVELREAVADPDEGAFAGVQVVVHLPVGGLLREDLLAVEVACVETGGRGDLDGVEPGEPRGSRGAEEPSGAEERALRLPGPEQRGDRDTSRFGAGLDGGDEGSGVDRG
ncbi:hypothetical protein ACH4MU_15595 [Streptomyces albidoflavus]